LLTKLSIHNYALIEDISIDFSKGLTTITGETGAGKSILLGGLDLILGKRADTKTLRNATKKCVIEGEFDITNYTLQPFFKHYDLDFEDTTILRRELLPSGKSRAFINDTPVKLELLANFKKYLIDIHSQHQTLQLGNVDFQFQLIDVLAATSRDIAEYKVRLKEYNSLQESLDKFKEQLAEATKQHDYHRFLFEELETADFKVGEQETLEISLEKGNNIEGIQQNLSAAYQLISNEDIGLQNQLYQLKLNFENIQSYDKKYQAIFNRLASIYIDIDDIETETANLLEQVVFDPKQLETTNSRIELLYNLFQKHSVSTITDLLTAQKLLSEKVSRVTNADELLQQKEKELAASKKTLLQLALQISKKRHNVVDILEKNLVSIVKTLGMPFAEFSIVLTQEDSFTANGIDRIQFLFNANKGGRLGEIKKMASGGELSRIMLAFKSIMAKNTQLPTIIFDEIDSGISGEMALKMAEIMTQMSQKMQVIAITHLPQIAASGTQQMKVFKQEDTTQTQTQIKTLSTAERVTEIAEMLGGKIVTDTAINHAKQLMVRF